jgi:diadenosine tetraphosphatase ApaH/serine/threonine PP2A family protein phosphatase
VGLLNFPDFRDNVGHAMMAAMLLALIADIHANELALQACLARIEALGAEKIVCLGDIVGYAADPEAVIKIVSLLQQKGAVVVKGNHDHAIAEPNETMNDAARLAIDWTRKRLSPAQKEFLAGLPLVFSEDGRLYVHGDASAPGHWNYVDGPAAAKASLAATKASVTFCGHVHAPALYCLSPAGKIISHVPVTDVPIPLGSHRRWLAVVGSVGQPRDHKPSAAFATYDTDTTLLTFRRAAYDVDEAAARVRRAGLPDVSAVRLKIGR